MHHSPRDYFAHQTAEIAETAVIGKGSKIWNDCQVREGAIIGEGCILGKGVYIDAGVSIGNNCKIQNYACIYHGVTIQDDVFVGPGTVFTNDIFPRSFNASWETVETTVMKGASIGANSTIRCGITLGAYCMIGAGSVVTRSISDFHLAYGNPARRMGTVNRRRIIERFGS